MNEEYAQPFKGRLSAWDKKLRTISDSLEELHKCQTIWRYLLPILLSDNESIFSTEEH